jgi:hypothetical protein
MADETTTAAGGAEQEAGSAAADSSGVEQQRTFSQADLDRLIDARMAKERQRAETQTAKAKADAEKKAAEESGQWQKLAEQYKTEAEQARQQAQAASLQVLRRDIAAKLNVPAVLADRLVGSTPEELEADAKTLLASLPKQPLPTANAGAGAKSAGVETKDMNAFIRAAAGRAQ